MTSSIEPSLRSALSDRYEIFEECGRGGSSVVYRARELSSGRTVAIKVMRPELASRAMAERFLREIRIAGTIDHPNVARLLDSGEADGTLYCVLEFIDGETLRSRITRDGPLPVEEALRLTRDVAEALTWAHRRGIVHRDVKPENVLLSGGRAILSDFGIARAIVVAAGDRLTDSGIAVGTASYMSPEQALGSSALDARTDQYALAVCLYEMLAGDPPFAGRTSQAILARQMAEPPPRLEVARPTVPVGIIAAIERALAKVPADRFGSVEEFVRALESGTTRLVRAKRRPSWVTGAVSALALAAVAAGGWWYINRWPDPDDSRVVVFPARTGATESDPDEGLRVADAIQIAVEHTDPLRWIPAWDDLDSATRANPGLLQRTEARRLARRRGARYYLTSAATTTAGRTSITMLLHDAAGDSLVAQESLSDSTPGAPTPVAALAIRALPRLLSRMLSPDRRVDLSPLTDRSLAAVARLLEGEEAYRKARFATAFDRYRAAVAEDSLFAYAAIKGAQAASWQNRLPEAIELIRLARASEGLLPAKYRPYLRGVQAYLEGRADDAAAGFRDALSADPGWAEAAMALGDTYYHLMPSEAPLDSLAAAAFATAFSIDSTFTPPLFHLGEISARRGDAVAARGYLRRLMIGVADPAWSAQLALEVRCAERGMSAADWREVAAASTREALLVAQAVSGGGGQLACAAGGFRAVLDAPQATDGEVWGAVLGLQGTLVAMGRSAEAARHLDSARAAIHPRAYSYAALNVHADSAFATLAADGASYARSVMGDRFERGPAKASWVFGLAEWWRGHPAALDDVVARLSQLARETGDPAASLALSSARARQRLAAGDTDGAIDLLLRRSVIAPMDSLSWQYFEPLAPDRLLLARLLLARGRPSEAMAHASAFDHPRPITFLAYLRASLELRVRAAEQMGQPGAAQRLRGRLRSLEGRRQGGG